MKKTFKIISCLLLLYTLGVSCSEQNKECSSTNSSIQKPLNPNGDSELALLMRAMFEEAEQIKQQIAKGEPITLSVDHEKILTAHATQPEKAASAKYQAFAKSYLQIIESLQSSSPAQSATLFDNVVNNCMSCHKALCPGPMVRIKKLHHPTNPHK